MRSTGSGLTLQQRIDARSVRTTKLFGSAQVQRFLDAARALITRRGSTDFTMHEVVDEAGQSLRSFYLLFDGKHELLLALYEEAIAKVAEQIREATGNDADPLDKLRTAVELLFEFCRPDPGAHRPLFTEFAPQLLMSDPIEIQVAHASLFELLADLVAAADGAGYLRTGTRPRRLAAMTLQTVMFVAQGARSDDGAHPITAAEVWNLCAFGALSRGAWG
ncbi:TetR/AcrR family transcriptional regulator [Nocardia carnea]|uniref:TetR/AcrR family transcriptional regulator n=1 Tax=Nocardia carnea TaxID=37328 RepID=UPI00245438C9|nr:TetR/AcrR family transcriptional regulator [Nocardia carnea]